MIHVIQGKKSGSVRFTGEGIIQDEDISSSVEVTSSPVEDVGEVSDGVTPNAKITNIGGKITVRSEAKEVLEKMQNEGDILNYRGRIRLDNCVIKNLSFKATKDNVSGYSFSATLHEILVATGARVAVTISMAQQDSTASSYTKANTSPKTEGRKTAGVEQLSASDYLDHVNTYNDKKYTTSTAETNKSYNGTK